MASEDVFHQVLQRWDDQVEYAETLRGRRTVYTTALVVVAGLGTFRLDPFMESGQTLAINSGACLWIIRGLIVAALCFLALGAYTLYTSGPMSREEKEAMSDAISPEFAKFYRSRTPRASTYLGLSREEEEALLVADSEVGWIIRSKKLQLAVRSLAASNLRVSNRVKTAGFWIGAGYLCLIVAVTVYTFSLKMSDETKNLTPQEDPLVAPDQEGFAKKPTRYGVEMELCAAKVVDALDAKLRRMDQARDEDFQELADSKWNQFVGKLSF